MPLLTKADLATHLYAEIIKEIIRDYSTSYATFADFPECGATGRNYVALDSNKTYIWNGEDYTEKTEAGIDLVQDAIDRGESEARSYLNRYNLTTMFNTAYTDKFLRGLVKDIVCWHIIKLANPNIDMALFRTLYEDAIKTLEKVMKGLIDPQWPLREDDAATIGDEAGNVYWSSETKRSNHY